MENGTISRTKALLGLEAIQRLAQSHVAVFGIGGVGGYAVEVLARSGIGKLDLFDNDRVSLSNVNRQIYALMSTVGQYKVDVAEKRILDINPDCVVKKHIMFYLPANADSIDLTQYDYVLDCIDTMAAKQELIKRCTEQGIPILSSMGAANKMDPTAFRVMDIFKTKMDPIAKIMRKKLKEAGVKKLKVVCSEEPPIKPLPNDDIANTDRDSTPNGKRAIPASNAFVPAAAGIIMGGEAVKDLILGQQTITVGR